MFSFPPKVRHASYNIAISALWISLLGNIFAVLYQSDVILGITAKKYSYIGHDVPRDLPLNVRPSKMVFRDDPEHFGMHGVRAWAEWSTVRPREGGFVYLGKSQDLPIAVDLWHAIHCITHFRTLLVKGDDSSVHTPHCFGYVRQTLLCGADMTLEERPMEGFDADGNEIFPGNGVEHVCRGDFQQIYEWTMEQRESWTPEMLEKLLNPALGNNHSHSHNHEGSMMW